MITASQTVTIERHEWDDANGRVALTFTEAVVGRDPAALPLVFVLHGLGSRKERHLDLCLRLARAGFRACAVDEPLHGERQTADSALLWSGDRNSLSFLQTMAGVALATVAELGEIATEFGAERYGVVGHSLGGFIALVTALSDRRAEAVVNIAGSLESRLPPTILAQLPPAVREIAARLDPLSRADEFWPTALLLLHGSDDQTVSVEGARRLYAALLPHYAADTSRLQLVEQAGVGHELNAEAAERAVAFLQQFLPTR